MSTADLSAAAEKPVQIWRPSSALAMRGAPPRAIQELAGHRELGMTQRYMHLSPAALDSAIRLLDQPLALQKFGDLVETGRVSEEKING